MAVLQIRKQFLRHHGSGAGPVSEPRGKCCAARAGWWFETLLRCRGHQASHCRHSCGRHLTMQLCLDTGHCTCVSKNTQSGGLRAHHPQHLRSLVPPHIARYKESSLDRKVHTRTVFPPNVCCRPRAQRLQPPPIVSTASPHRGTSPCTPTTSN